MSYNPNIHHRKSTRLQGFDYSKAGLYFLTICCEDRMCLFGEIRDGIMHLNEAGNIADTCWIQIPQHFPNVTLHAYVVMPNHIHGIIEIVKEGKGVIKNGDQSGLIGNEFQAGAVGAENFLPLQQPNHHAFQKMIPRSVSSIVKGYKIGVTKWFRENTPIEKVWQRNFHDHVIRNDQSYQAISTYIINNPRNWIGDRFYRR